MFKKQQHKHRGIFVYPLHFLHFLYSVSEKLDTEGFLCITKNSEWQLTTHRGKRQGEMVFAGLQGFSLCSSLPSECIPYFIGLGFVCVQPHFLFSLRENKSVKKTPNSNRPCRFDPQNSWIVSSPPSLLQTSQFWDSPHNLQMRQQLWTDEVSLLQRPKGEASWSKRQQERFGDLSYTLSPTAPLPLCSIWSDISMLILSNLLNKGKGDGAYKFTKFYLWDAGYCWCGNIDNSWRCRDWTGIGSWCCKIENYCIKYSRRA